MRESPASVSTARITAATSGSNLPGKNGTANRQPKQGPKALKSVLSGPFEIRPGSTAARIPENFADSVISGEAPP